MQIPELTMKEISLFLLLFLMFQNIFSQQPVVPPRFASPLDIPLILSGNFGELRSDHFHSGVDFKTQGVIGKNVYSVADGYVSRIKIQTLGYGNSIYITHPDGLTSVYGHLDGFTDSIASYVRAYQYQKKTHTLDIYPDKELFKVSKGEKIALSGNTGSSGGPHLHFELRGTASQHPLNALKYGFNVRDKLPPQLYNLFVYPIGETLPGKYTEPKIIALRKDNGKYRISPSDTLMLKGKIGFGLEANDFLNDANNQCGVYTIELLIDELPYYIFRIDEFSFGESSYINAHTDYRARAEKNRKIHLLYRKPNNQLSLYPYLKENGLITFPAGKTSKVEVRVGDAHGNSSELIFYVKGNATALMLQKADSLPNSVFKWNTANYYENSQVRLMLPANSLYEDYQFNYARTDIGYQKAYPYTHYLGDSYTPLHKPADLSISGEMIPLHLRSKTFIAAVNEGSNISCLSSTWNGSRISARIKKLGKYTIVIDSVAPVIIPINVRQGANMTMEHSMRFVVTDELSGVAEYMGYIDEEWVLFEYDPKNNQIQHTFDTTRLISGSDHELKLIVRDAAGNQKTYQTRFRW